MDILIFMDCHPEDHDQLIAALDKVFSKPKKDSGAAERAKRYRDKKRAEKQITEKNVTDNVTNNKEEREEEREGISPSVPSSLPSSPSDSLNNYPITPIIPSSQEKEEEREESLNAAADEKKKTYGLANNVKLTESEYLKLEEKLGYPAIIDLVDALSIYMAQNPKNANKYKNHYYTILNWHRRNSKYIVPNSNNPPEPTENFLDDIDWEGKDE